MAWLTRTWVLAGGAVLLVGAAVAASLVFVDRDGGGDRDDTEIAGPHGAYPAALGDGPVTGPSTDVTRGNDPIVIDGIRVERSDDLITAYDVRTAAEYWTYGRADVDPGPMAARKGALFVRWDDGLLVRFDPRTAQARWNSAVTPDSRLVVTDSQVAIWTDTTVTAYAAESGDEAWSTDLPTDCSPRDVEAVGDTVVATLTCGGALLLDRTGASKRIDGPSALRIAPIDGEWFALAELDGDATVHAVGTGEARAVARFTAGTYDSGNGEVLVASNSAARASGDIAYAGWDLAGEQVAWTVPTDGSWHPEGPAVVVDDAVYTIRRDRPDWRTFMVLDAATGAIRNRIEFHLADYLAGTDLPYSEVDLRMSHVAPGSVTLTFGEPGLDTVEGCEQCSLVLRQAG